MLLLSASCRCPAMPMSAAPEASDYVLLHRDTGSALYTTRATEQEIHRANSSLSRAGQRSLFVAARYLMHHQPVQDS
ncbi:MAG: hypothetical protein R6W06_09825 [Prochlorococcaceae cyanobacterium]